MTQPDSAPPVGMARLTLFSAGDFACNLYWQSVTLFLLFFYTDVLLLPPAVAGIVAMAGAVWDGLADLAVGIVAQRARAGYRRFIAWGSAPLGMAFVAMFLLPHGSTAGIALLALAAQVVFRTLYALVNIPYAAWSTRISPHSRDRATIAGLRMVFGTAAATIVALVMPRAGSYALAAAGFAAVAVPLLWIVAARSRDAVPMPAAPAPPVDLSLAALARNRAFVSLNLAMAAAGIAAAVINQSVLHYFDHVVGDAGAGPRTLALMGVAGAVCVPVWMLVARAIGARAAWLCAATVGLASLGVYLSAGAGVGAAQAYLVATQMAFAGFNLAFWALLPDSVDYGEAQTGVRVEGIAFGVAALVQKLALAAAAGALGLAYHRIGYVPGTMQTPATIAGIRATMLIAAGLGLAIATAAMLANPLARGVHARLLRDLRR